MELAIVIACAVGTFVLVVMTFILLALSRPAKPGIMVRASSPEEAIENSGLTRQELATGIITATPEHDDIWRVEYERINDPRSNDT